MKRSISFSTSLISLALAAIVSSQAQARPRITIGAIGDSLSTAFDASYVGNNYQFSWSTGNSNFVDSHYLRIKHSNPEYDVRAYNEAVAGSTSQDLPAQVAAILTHPLDFLTITMGANDICGGTISLEDTRTNLREALRTIIYNRPDVRIMILGVPDLYKLRQLPLDLGYCSLIWNNPIHPVCQPLLADNRSDAERLAFRGQWVQLNQLLNSFQTEFPNNVRVASEVASQDFTLDDISSIDCFHPSLEGQRRIAEATWDLW